MPIKVAGGELYIDLSKIIAVYKSKKIGLKESSWYVSVLGVPEEIAGLSDEAAHDLIQKVNALQSVSPEPAAAHPAFTK